MNYFLHLGTAALIYLLLTQSMNLYLGFTGILALSHIAFYGVGAYTSAIVTLHGGSFWAGFLLAGLVSGLLGFLLGLTSMRLRADYLAIATLAFSQIVLSVFQNWENLTRGPFGLPSIPRPSIFGIQLTEKFHYFLFVLVIAIILMAFMYRLVKSPFGQILETIRDDEVAAKTLGKNTVQYKLIIFTLGAMIAAFAGSLYAHFITFISPTSFVIEELALVLVMTVIGGLGTFRGPIIGVFLIFIIFEPLRFLNLPVQLIGPLRQLLYSLIFLLAILYLPRGLGGYWKTGKKRTRSFTPY